jgi:signal transduction histidine kinase
VIGAMLVYFGFRQQHTAEEAARLAAWQPDAAVGADSRTVLEAFLAHAAEVFAAPRAILVLHESEEPWASVSVWEHGRFHQEWPIASTVETMVPEALAQSGFIRTSAGDVLAASGPGRLELWRGTLLGPQLASYGLEQVLSVPVRSESAAGRLFVADRANFSREDLMVAWLLAAQIGAALDRMQVIEAAKQSAAMEERLRLARDLHDGILQSLAGTALQLETLKDLAGRDPGAARSKIDEIQSWLGTEQREMRGFIGKLRPARPPAGSGSGSDQFDLPALVRALEQQWGVAITLSPQAAGLLLPADLEFHARQIIREAIANSVRHGGASEVSVQMDLNERRLSLTIVDNGTGLPVHGQFDERQSAQSPIGPRSLRERVVSLSGSLLINSTAGGLTLSIDLPLRSTNATADHHPDRR